MADRSLVVRLRAEVDQYRRDMTEAAKATAGVGQAAQDAGRQRTAMQQLGDAGKGVGRTLAAVSGAAVAGMAALTVGTFRTGIAYNTLEQTSRAALTTLLGSAAKANEQMDLLREFGRSSPFPRQVWIEAQQQLLAFGLAAEDIIPTLSAIQDAVAAAGGSAVDISEVVRVLAQVQSTGKATAETLNQLGVRGIDAATLIGNAMGKTAAEIREDISSGALDAATFLTVLTDAMTDRFGGAAANVKNTWLGATDRIKGALRDIGSAMAEPFVDPAGGGAAVTWANDVADALRALEGQIRAILPTVRELAGPAFERVSELLQTLAERIRDADIDVGGLIDQVSAGGPAFAAFGTGIAAAGSASALSAVGMGGLATAINPLAAGILALVATSPELRDLLFELLAALQPLLPVVTDTALAFATGLTTGAAAVAEVLQMLVPVIEALVGVFTALPEPVQTATVGLAAFAVALRFGGPVGVAIAALTTLGFVLESFGGSAKDTSVDVSGLASDLERLIRTGRVTADLKNLFGTGAQGAEEFADKLKVATAEWSDWDNRLNRTFDEIHASEDAFKALDTAMADLVKQGMDADEVFAGIVDTYDLTEQQIEDLRSLLPKYTSEAERQAEASREGADAAGELAGEQNTLAGATDEATRALREQADELRAQTDPVFALFKALQEARDAQAAYNQAVDEFGAGSDEAATAAVGLLEAAVGLQGAAGDASGTFDGKLTPAMRNALIAAGYTEEQIAAVEEQLGDTKAALEDYTGRYEAEVAVRGAEAAREAVERVNAAIARLHDRSVTITTNWVQQGAGAIPPGFGGSVFERWGGIVKAASGRLVPAHIASSPTVLFGERETGREAFIPMRGDERRSLAILSEAASWFGASVVRDSRFARSATGGAASRAPTPVPVAGVGGGGQFTGRLFLDSGQFLGVVRGEIDQHDEAMLRDLGQGVGAVT